ncbi:MAG TPA: NADH-quinone oxidoreductase subunit H [Gemmatimonadales bacterium]|nr:NADH-quinone oxidoreductase subunit H [Gemmatimonadales bacterium]
MTFTPIAGLALVLVLAPALPGIATRTRAALTGRRGAPILQLYFDLAKLARKNVVYSRTTTPVFQAGAVLALSAVVVAALLLPLDGQSAILSFSGDLVAFAGLLALGRFALVLAGLDTGSSFEGMGASREVTIAAFAEPALFLCFTVLYLATGALSLEGMLGVPLAEAWVPASPALALTGAALFMLALAETCRVPVDDPATHLELTMIHEVIILDHSGPDLGLILYGSALKLALFSGLVVSVFVPRGALPPVLAILVLLAGLVLIAVAIGVVEATMARLRMNRVSQFLVAAGALAAFGVILELR